MSKKPSYEELEQKVKALAQELEKYKQYDDTLINNSAGNFKETFLSKNEHKYVSLMDAMSQAAYICSADFRVVYMNPVMKNRVGKEAIGELCYTAVHGFEKRCSWCVFDEVKKGNRTEREIKSPKDNHIFIVSSSPIYHPDGSISMMNIFTDITARKQAEEKLIESANRVEFLADIIEKTQQPIAIGYPDGRLGFCNQAFCQLTGYTVEELKYMDWAKVLTPPEWLPSEMKALKELERTGKPVQYEKEYIRKNGTRAPIDMLVHIVKNLNGKVQYYYAFITDITERKFAEKKLKHSELRYKELFNRMSSGVAIYKASEDGEKFFFKDINKAGERIGQVKKEEIVNRRVQDVFPNVEDIGIIKVFQDVWKTGKAQFHPISLYKDDRIFSWVDNYVYKLPSGEVVAVYDDVTERKQAEEDIRRSKILLESSLESTKDMIILAIDSDYRYLFFNKTHAETMNHVFGTQPQLGDCIISHMKGKDDIEKMKAHFDRALAGEGHIAIEEYGEGQLRYYYEIQYNPIYDENNEIIGVTSFSQNITERLNAEAKIKDSELKFRQLFNEMKDGLAIYESIDGGKDFVLRDINAAGERIGNVKKENILGKSIYEIRPNIDLFGFVDVLRRVWQTGKPEHHTEKFYQDEELQGYFDNYVYKLDSENVVAIVSDNTARQIAQEALKKSEERFSLAMRFSNDGLFDWNLETNQIFYSPGWKRLLGYDDDEIKNEFSEWERLTKPEDVQSSWAMLNKVLEGKLERFYKEFKMLHKNGYWVDILSRANVVRDENGKALRVVGTHVDITERNKMKEQLLQSHKMEAIGALAGGIAHDFNNMIGIISGNISYLLNCYKKDEELVEVLSDIQEGAQRSQQLTQQLLTFSKGGAPIKKAANINSIIEESSQFVIRGANVKCNFELSEDLWITEVDSGQLNQVISNLVINANQAMPNGGIINIRSENTEIDTKSTIPLPAGKYIKIIMEDKGVGISEKHLPNIFDPYFSTKQTGSGLGLATSYSIIQKHGGFITVDSKLDEGTTFYIYLPVSDKKRLIVDGKEKFKHKGHGKILIMDDEEPIYKMIYRILNKMGYQPHYAMDGKLAIEMYKTALESGRPFDLTILDLTVPGGMGGKETMKELLKIDTNIRAVVSSGYSNDPVMSNYKDYGFCGVIPKPYLQDQVADVLNKIFRKKA